MSEPWQRRHWPQGVPQPDSTAWPDAAIRWLGDNIPGNRWRYDTLRRHPWIYCTLAAITLRADIENLRTQYRTTANSIAGLLTPDEARRLLDDTTREGKRLTLLLEQVLALDEALAPDGMRRGPDVRPGP